MLFHHLSVTPAPNIGKTMQYPPKCFNSLNTNFNKKYKKTLQFCFDDPIGPKTTKVQNQECHLGYYISFSKIWIIVEKLKNFGYENNPSNPGRVKRNRKCRTSERLLVPSL